ncbi:MAG: DUF302 domain-containing protein [Spirochaetia bacterium]|nr:DUF302 domain-containing protein [Spirochaetia bacterium]
MYYIKETQKNFRDAATDLETCIKKNGFGILHIHNIGETLRSKGVAFQEECKVFEICNPQQAWRVLQSDLRLNMALPCRISIYTENQKTRIGMIKPDSILSMLSSDPALQAVASEVEDSTRKMIDEAIQDL